MKCKKQFTSGEDPGLVNHDEMECPNKMHDKIKLKISYQLNAVILWTAVY